jgi:hypothetical protein
VWIIVTPVSYGHEFNHIEHAEGGLWGAACAGGLAVHTISRVDHSSLFIDIVIGSGFGGAVAAGRLVRADLKVRVLERGPWRRAAPVLEKGMSQAVALPSQDRPGLILRTIRSSKGLKEICLNRRGLLELHLGKGVKTLASSGSVAVAISGRHWWRVPMMRNIGTGGQMASLKPLWRRTMRG